MYPGAREDGADHWLAGAGPNRAAAGPTPANWLTHTMTAQQEPPPLPSAKDAPAADDEDAAQAAVAERHEAAVEERDAAAQPEQH